MIDKIPRLVFTILAVLFVIVSINTLAWVNFPLTMLGMACAVLLLNVDAWYLAQISVGASNIIQSLVYSFMFIMLQGDAAVKNIIILMVMHLIAHQPKEYENTLLINNKGSFVWGLSLIVLEYVLSALGMVSGMYDVTDLPFHAQIIRNLLFTSSLVVLFYHMLVSKRQVLVKQLENQDRDWLSDLLNLIAHNIRTPMGSIFNRIQIIKLKAANDRPIAKDEIEKMEADNDRIMAIVNQLLHHSTKYANSNVNKTKTLASILDELHQEERLKIENPSNIGFTMGMSYARTLELCLDSLIQNAKKYSVDDIEMRISETRHEYQISIKDQGVGMTETQIKNYGTPFVASSNSKGSGLGLYVLLQLVRKQGWNWALDSKIRQGTTTTIYIYKKRLYI